MCLEQEARAPCNIMFAEILDRDLMRQMFKYVFECTPSSMGLSHQKIAFNGKARLILINMTHSRPNVTWTGKYMFFKSFCVSKQIYFVFGLDHMCLSTRERNLLANIS